MRLIPACWQTHAMGSLLFLLAGMYAVAADPAPPQPAVSKWEATIAKFEQADRVAPPQPGGNLFVGSSSIVKWSTTQAFPDLPVINRGFGGSKLPEVLEFFDRVVTPYHPSVIVLYCGDNDIGAGRTPEQVRDDYLTFVQRTRAVAPEAKIVWIAIKPSGKRWNLREKAQQANALVKAAQADHKNEVTVDVWGPMLGSDGTPRPELFVADQLHLSEAGYDLWNQLVRPHLVTRPAAAGPQ